MTRLTNPNDPPETNSPQKDGQPQLTSEQIAQRTGRLEMLRAVATGLIEFANASFFMLIAVRIFDCSSLEKSLLVGGGSAGLMFSIVLVFFAKHSGLPIAKIISSVVTVAAFCLLLSAVSFNSTMYVCLIFLATLLISSAPPIITTIYQHNIPPQRRGKIYGRVNLVKVASNVALSLLLGQLLVGRLEDFRIYLVLVALATVWSSRILLRVPSVVLDKSEKFSVFSGFHWLGKDPVFRNTLIAWMFMGIGILMMVAVRVDYLANPEHGLNLREDQVILFVSAIPGIVRLVFSPIWGWVFDHMNFFGLRAILNLNFLVGNLAFFTSGGSIGLTIGAILLGLATAGGDIAWNLWVTKFAPTERVPDYMAVHTFLTGVRGVLSPFLAFWLLQSVGMLPLSLISSSLILISVVMLIPEFRRRQRPE